MSARQSRAKADNRLAPTVSKFAAAEIESVAALIGQAPSTVAARGIEAWVLSEEFQNLKRRAQEAASQGGTE